MIIDGHAYCFPPVGRPSDFPTVEDPLRHLQREMGIHHQPAWRLRDRAPADVSGIIDDDDWSSLQSLRAAQFHAAGFGRFEWTVRGEVYAKQYQPPSLVDMAYPPAHLVAEMDYADVQWAVLHKFAGASDEYLADCVRRFPTRLKALANVEEWLVADDPGAAIEKLRHAIEDLGLCGLQFLPYQMDLYERHESWDGRAYRPFWDAVAQMGIPVFFTLIGRIEPVVQSYRSELEILMAWMARYPDVTVVHTHGLAFGMHREGDWLNIPEYVWKPFDNPKLHLQLLFPIGLGHVWDYPMPQVRPTLQECLQRLGAHRLMWGTDMPMVLRYWTYRQNIDFIRKHCEFLTPVELDAILGGTTARLVGIELAERAAGGEPS